MKKLTAMILALVMVLTLAAGAFAAGRLTKDEAKKEQHFNRAVLACDPGVCIGNQFNRITRIAQIGLCVIIFLW